MLEKYQWQITPDAPKPQGEKRRHTDFAGCLFSYWFYKGFADGSSSSSGHLVTAGWHQKARESIGP